MTARMGTMFLREVSAVQYFMGRELTVVFAAEGRKRPDDMRRKEGPSRLEEHCA